MTHSRLGLRTSRDDRPDRSPLATWELRIVRISTATFAISRSRVPPVPPESAGLTGGTGMTGGPEREESKGRKDCKDCKDCGESAALPERRARKDCKAGPESRGHPVFPVRWGAGYKDCRESAVLPEHRAHKDCKACVESADWPESAESKACAESADWPESGGLPGDTSRSRTYRGHRCMSTRTAPRRFEGVFSEHRSQFRLRLLNECSTPLDIV